MRGRPGGTGLFCCLSREAQAGWLQGRSLSLARGLDMYTGIGCGRERERRREKCRAVYKQVDELFRGSLTRRRRSCLRRGALSLSFFCPSYFGN